MQHFPDDCEMIEVAKSRAFLVKKDIFRNLMWYTMPDSTKQYPLTIERVKKIKALNRQGIKPEELEPVEVTSNKPKEIEPEYVDVVGQISLRSLEKNSRKRREKEMRNQPPRGESRHGGQNQQHRNPNQQNRPPQNRTQQPRNPNQQRPPQNNGNNANKK